LGGGARGEVPGGSERRGDRERAHGRAGARIVEGDRGGGLLRARGLHGARGMGGFRGADEQGGQSDKGANTHGDSLLARERPLPSRWPYIARKMGAVKKFPDILPVRRPLEGLR